MRYFLTESSLTVHVDNPRSNVPQVKNLPELLILPEEQIRLVLDATLRKAVGKGFHTQSHYIYVFLRPLGRFLKWSKLNQLPSDFGEWQFFLCQWALWHISNDESSMALESRCTNWNSVICPLIGFFVDEDIIPLGVSIPNLKLPKEVVTGLSKPTIGLHSPTSTYKHSEPKKVDNTLAGPLFWKDDVTYLDEFLARLKEKDEILGKVLDDYWFRLVADYRKGKKVIKEISDEEFASRLSKNDWKEKIFPGLRAKTLVTSPYHPRCAAWTLQILQRFLVSEDKLSCINAAHLRKHPAFLTYFAREWSSAKPFMDLSKLKPHQLACTDSYLIITRMLGLLNCLDMSVAMALLIREHPNFNPESLAGAKLLCAAGKYYLLPQGEGRAAIFSVDKPRARSRKYCELSPRAARVLRHILRATDLVRELMKRAGIPQWRYLFLGVINEGTTRTLGHPVSLNAGIFHRSQGCTLLNYYPELAKHDLKAGSLSFARIRNTQGVLDWFDGGIGACAVTLGNTEEVSMKNYIPESLLNAWNERLIRRFQNTLILLAAAKEEYLLDVVDFKTVADLQQFIAQLIFENRPEDSILAKKIHELFGNRYTFHFNVNASELARDGLLYVKLSSESLAILIGYKNWALINLSSSQLTLRDSETGRSPSDFVKLADMIQSLVAMPNPSEVLREAHDLARLKRVHSDAKLLISTIAEKFNSMSIMSGQE